jgi:4'-phosphopantetheinyl transferase
VLALAPGEIHLWFVFFDEVRDESLLHRYRQMLPDVERQRELRFHFSEDRHRYLVTRASVRTVLSRYAPMAPEDWRFVSNEYGKPEVASDDPMIGRISFNLSHTKGLMVLGITRDHALGVDSENMKHVPAPVEEASSFFSPTEILSLRSLPEDMRQERFFQYWTLKEAYIKARGMGLSIPLDQFSFHFPQGRPGQGRSVELAFSPPPDDLPSRWRLWQFQVGGRYLASMCVERSKHAGQWILLRKLTPTGEDDFVDHVLLCESG